MDIIFNLFYFFILFYNFNSILSTNLLENGVHNIDIIQNGDPLFVLILLLISQISVICFPGFSSFSVSYLGRITPLWGKFF